MNDQRIIKIAYGLLYINSSISFDSEEEMLEIYSFLYSDKISEEELDNAINLINEPPKYSGLKSPPLLYKEYMDSDTYTSEYGYEDFKDRMVELACEIDDEDFLNRKFIYKDYEKYCDSMIGNNFDSEQEEQNEIDNWDENSQDRLNDERYKPNLFEENNVEIDPMEIKRDAWGNLYTEGGRMWDRYMNKSSNEDDF